MTLDDAVDSFIEHVAVAKSQYTCATYRVALTRFARYVAPRRDDAVLDVSLLGVSDVDGFARALKRERALAASTRELYLTTLVLFVRYLVRVRALSLDVADAEQLRALAKAYRERRSRMPHVPLDEHVERVLVAARSRLFDEISSSDELVRLRALRDLALVECAHSSGARVGELVSLTRGSLDRAHKAARVVGKGNKEGYIYFDLAAWRALLTYLDARGDGASRSSLASAPLFAEHSRRSRNGKALTTSRVRQVLDALNVRAGLEQSERLTPHAFRHHFLMRVLDATQDIVAAQELARHASIVTTRAYLSISPTRARNAHAATFNQKE